MTNINVLNCSGLFESTAVERSYVNESGNTISFTAKVKDTKDPLLMIIDLSEFTDINGKLIFGDSTKVSLVAEKINVIPFTTHGIKDEDGNISFKISSNVLSMSAAMKIEVNIISYTPVINH